MLITFHEMRFVGIFESQIFMTLLYGVGTTY